MDKDEDLDCKVLSVMMRHLKNILKYFSFGICPLALLDSGKPGLLRVKKVAAAEF